MSEYEPTAADLDDLDMSEYDGIEEYDHDEWVNEILADMSDSWF